MTEPFRWINFIWPCPVVIVTVLLTYAFFCGFCIFRQFCVVGFLPTTGGNLLRVCRSTSLPFHSPLCSCCLVCVPAHQITGRACEHARLVLGWDVSHALFLSLSYNPPGTHINQRREWFVSLAVEVSLCVNRSIEVHRIHLEIQPLLSDIFIYCIEGHLGTISGYDYTSWSASLIVPSSMCVSTGASIICAPDFSFRSFPVRGSFIDITRYVEITNFQAWDRYLAM